LPALELMPCRLGDLWMMPVIQAMKSTIGLFLCRLARSGRDTSPGADALPPA